MSKTPLSVSLVIPAHNAERTLGACLEASCELLNAGQLSEIIVVNDHSTDRTAEIIRSFPVKVYESNGRGPGAARNTGWAAAESDLVWFIDADCVPESDALTQLLTHFVYPEVRGVGGSYGIADESSLLARLIHEEILLRHSEMPLRVNVLASFNLVYRRDALSVVGGFNERFQLAQDAELSYRVLRRGGELRFEKESRVRHYHPTKLFSYLFKQARQGYWRVWLYLHHPLRAGGDSYTKTYDVLQPPCAVLLVIVSLLYVLAPHWIAAIAAVLVLAAFLLLHAPMAAALVYHHGFLYLAFYPLSLLRSLYRAAGMLAGACAALIALLRGRFPSVEQPAHGSL
ncbi:MAG TPA: glycosyltransferase [Oligoflexia bacterium]|nr:glycosyltransferase [Oligoflexia bacterium]